MKYAWDSENNKHKKKRDIHTNGGGHVYSEEQLHVTEAYIPPNTNLGEINEKGNTVIDDFGTDERFCC